MRVLVLDGNQNQAVASVRSLAKAGHQVLVGESSSWSKAGWSRSCHGTFRYPDPHQDVSGFLARISEMAKQQSGTLVLPMTEATTLPLSAHREVLVASGAKLVLPSHDDVLRAFNKEETVRLASSLGIAVPKTTVVCSPEQAREACATTKFPAVLKPRSSVEAHSDGAMQITGRPRYARNAEELQALYLQMSRTCSRVLVQEFVDGEGTGYFALMHQGELRAEFAHRRIRDVHPTGSGSAVRISVEPDAQVRSASLAILQALHWHGVAMVEFRPVPRGRARFHGGQRTLLEFPAPRLLRGSRLPSTAGADGRDRRRREAEFIPYRSLVPLAPGRFSSSCGSMARSPGGLSHGLIRDDCEPCWR